MASRHHISPPAVLRTHGARPIYGRGPPSRRVVPGESTAGVAGPEQPQPQPQPSTAEASAKKQGRGGGGVDNGNNDSDRTSCVGITVGGVDVMTCRGASIGSESEMEDLTDFIERTANGTSAEVSGGDGGGSRAAERGGSSSSRRRRRRLVPPEIVFPGAFVSARFRGVPIGGGGGDEGHHKDSPRHLTVTFDARSALGEWAEAHGPLPSDDASSDGGGVDGPGGCRGVSILRSVDARLWSDRGRGGTPVLAVPAAAAASASVGPAAPGALKAKKRGSGGGGTGAGPKDALASSSGIASDMSIASVTSAASAASNTEFRYDWTYSTPYGSTVASSPPSRTAMLEAKFNRRNEWSGVRESGIDLTLLSDRTQPILYYDDVNLYEDDLHDNGTSLLNIKVRVMPKCLFILSRLFVRVDYVMIRVRDVRVYHRFGTDRVWRDVTWRECPWDGLMKAGLPDDVGRWRAEDGADASVQAAMGKVPEVALPNDLTEHSCLDLALTDS